MTTATAGQAISTPWLAAPGVVTQSYGDTTFEKPRHTGIDIGVPYGTKIYAPFGGTVVDATHSRTGYGNSVTLDIGNGVEVVLGHMADFFVSKGQQLAPGAVVGVVDSTGFSTGNHLHFETRKAPFTYLSDFDPLAFLSAKQNASGQWTAPDGGLLGVAESIGHVGASLGLENQGVVNTVSGTGTDAAKTVKPVLDWVTGLGKALTWLTDPTNWWRVGFVATGVVVIGAGALIYFREPLESAGVKVAKVAAE